jgi:hypothetical protein
MAYDAILFASVGMIRTKQQMRRGCSILKNDYQQDNHTTNLIFLLV